MIIDTLEAVGFSGKGTRRARRCDGKLSCSGTSKVAFVPGLYGILAAIGATASIEANSSSVIGYPNKPIRVIVGQAPGGGLDIVARALAQKLTGCRTPGMADSRRWRSQPRRVPR